MLFNFGEKIFKKFSQLMSLSIWTMVALTVLGALLVIFPNLSLTVITAIVAALLILVGVYLIVKNVSEFNLIYFTSLGILLVLLGIVTILRPEIIQTLIPILVGIYLIIDALYKIKMSLILKDAKYRYWWVVLVFTIITIMCGCLMIVYPQVGATAIMTFIGIILIVSSVSNLVELFIFKGNVNTITDSLKKDFGSEVKDAKYIEVKDGDKKKKQK